MRLRSLFVLTDFAPTRIVYVIMQLSHARRAAGLTQAQLSKLSGVNQQIISRIESGQVKSPSYRTVVRLCRALRVAPDAIDEFQLPENHA